MICCRSLCKVFSVGTPRELSVLQDVDLQVEQGTSCVILGASGVGKSVLLKILLGLLPLTSGEVWVHGLSVQDCSHRKDYLRSFGILFQGGALFDSMTILENIVFPLMERGMPRVQAREIAYEKLAAVGLEERVSTLLPSELSGGMQKRAALARAIAFDPKVLLFDEPTTGLDPVTSIRIIHLLQETVQSLGATAMTITHDWNAARVLADQACLLHAGKIAWQGTRQDLSTTTHPLLHQFRDAAL
ncbi:MAG: ATP-binding cassette domain-containing protein, partial [Holosporales bacterium]|nr:ATP-binding cassette domain-containing protein [Holosporales bacterium]